MNRTRGVSKRAKRGGLVALALASFAACVPRSRMPAPLAIIPDSGVYHYVPASREPGAYRVRLAVRLRNQSADTVFLAGPCGASGRPARWFLVGDGDQEAALALWGCIGAVERSKAAPDPTYFAVPPHGEHTDSVWVFARPRALPTPPVIPWEQLAGSFRVAYQRMERRGWPRRGWYARSYVETVSRPFRLVRPDSQ